MNPTHVLDVEVDYFEQHREEWFEHHAGKIAIVHETTIHGFYDNYENALVAAYDKCGNVSFLLKKVLLEDEVVVITRLFGY